MQENEKLEKEVMQEEQTETAQTAQEAAETESTQEQVAAEETAQADPDAESAGEEAESEEKPGKKDPKDLQIEELKDKVIRQMAEFDNYRKRTEREKAQNYDIGASDFITKILPIVDNFERGMEALSEEQKETSYVQGFIMIYKQLKKVLDDAGVVEIEAR